MSSQMHLIMGAVSLWTRPQPCTCVQGPKKSPHQLINALMSCPSQETSRRMQLSELDCLLHDGTQENLHDEHNRDIGQKVAKTDAKHVSTDEPSIAQNRDLRSTLP